MPSIKDTYSVRPIQKWECKEWLLRKHYARRIPPISFAFGLFQDAELLGVCTLGIPASRFEFSIQPYELNRLVIADGLDKNTLSLFVGGVLRQITTSEILVSYADENAGHHGYIYQATNWIYTGRSSAEKRMFVDGQELHRKSLYNSLGTSGIASLEALGKSVEFQDQLGKHRYFQFTGRDKKRLLREVIAKFPVLPYPKGDNRRYDASFAPVTQDLLFF